MSSPNRSCAMLDDKTVPQQRLARSQMATLCQCRTAVVNPELAAKGRGEADSRLYSGDVLFLAASASGSA